MLMGETPRPDGPTAAQADIEPREAVRRVLELTGESSVEALELYLGQTGRNCISPTPLFDVAYYLDQLPPNLSQMINPLLHYFETGARLGLKPNPVFDETFIVHQLADRGEPQEGPALLALIAQRHGPYLAPHPLFDPETYRKAAGLPEDGPHPLAHFLAQSAYDMTPFSPFFDVGFYLHQNPHLDTAKANPLVHYLTQGLARAAEPNPMFHAAYYRMTYGHDGADALAHYVSSGIHAGHLPNPYAAREIGPLGVTTQGLRAYITTSGAMEVTDER